MNPKILTKKENNGMLAVEIRMICGGTAFSFTNSGEKRIELYIYSERTPEKWIFKFELNPQQHTLPLKFNSIKNIKNNPSYSGKISTVIKNRIKILEYN